MKIANTKDQNLIWFGDIDNNSPLVDQDFKTLEKIIVSSLKLNKFNPDIILMFGQAGGRNTIRIERIAINIDDSLIPDNTGYQPIDQLINSNGPTGYLSTLPIRNIYNRLNEAGFPVSISNSAGTYVCNHLMFTVLDYISNHKDHQIAGFIHVPYIHEQVKDKPNMFSMDLNEITQAIKVIINLLTEESL